MVPLPDQRRALLRASIYQVRLFFTALQFFTRLPIPRWVGFEPDWLSHAARYFPAVGLVIAALSGAAYALAMAVWPQPIAVLLSTIVGIWLTGAFHEDGFADMCDSFGGGLTKERVLDNMKDSRIGAYGTIGIGMVIGFKCTTLAVMPPQAVVMALLAAHPLSRYLATCLIWRLEYVKDEGRAKPVAHRLSNGEWAVGGLSRRCRRWQSGCSWTMPRGPD